MSLTVQQLVLDAKKLVKKLKDSESAADTLILKSQNVSKLLETRKLSEDMTYVCEGSNYNTNFVRNGNVYLGSRHLKFLQDENQELRAAIEDYNLVAEIIMSKYREQITRILGSSKSDVNLCTRTHEEALQETPERIKVLTERVQEMGSLMGVAAKLDEDYEVKTAELIARLTVENKGLKDLLNISNNPFNNSVKLSSEESGIPGKQTSDGKILH